MKLKRPNSFAAIIAACFAVWIIKDDIPFMLYAVNMDQSFESRGTVTAMHVVSGKFHADHLVEFVSDDGECSGKSDVAGEHYTTYKVGAPVPILQNPTGCVLTTDLRLYAPPRLTYLKTGFFILLALAALAGARWRKKKA